MKADIEIELSTEEDGRLTGKLSIPALGIDRQQLSAVEMSGERIEFGIPEAPGDARFQGALAEDQMSISGIFSQAGRSFPFHLQRGGAEEFDAGKYRPGAEKQLATSIANHLVEGYLDEERGRELAEIVLRASEDGALPMANDGRALASLWTEFLQAASQDIHLRLLYHLEEPDSVATPEAEPSSPIDFGFRRVEVLPDNVGYIDLREFSDAEVAMKAADDAMSKLAGADAIIIDLGRNGGGSPLMVRYLSSYFFAEPTHLVSTMIRGEPQARERWTLENVGGIQRPDLPLYILTSERTVSAAESFLLGMKARGRATSVGETTAGGGHLSKLVYLGDGFTLELPIGRTFDPESGQGWEGKGIEPDVPIPYSGALESALQLARRQRRTLSE